MARRQVRDDKRRVTRTTPPSAPKLAPPGWHFVDNPCRTSRLPAEPTAMLRLKILFQCLAQALATQGARSLTGIVPFGEVIYQVAMDTVQRLRDTRRDAEVRDSLEWAASAGRDEVRAEVAAVV